MFKPASCLKCSDNPADCPAYEFKSKLLAELSEKAKTDPSLQKELKFRAALGLLIEVDDETGLPITPQEPDDDDDTVGVVLTGILIIG